MKPKLFLISIITFFISSCSIHLVPVENIITRESNGIIITAGEQNISFFKDDLYLPVYITIANNTDKKIKIDYSNFMMVDDLNNQFTSVPIEEIKKEAKEKNKKYEKFSCPPMCYPYQTPYYDAAAISPYLNSGYNPYYPSLYPYLSADPFLYYKDKDNNFQIMPSYPAPVYPIPYEFEEVDPQLMALRMEEIFPHFQIQGYIYFHQSARLAKEKVTLLVNIPEYTEKSLEFEFFIK